MNAMGRYNYSTLIQVMAWCLQETDKYLNVLFCIKEISIFIQISLRFIPGNSIYNKSLLVQVIAWHQSGHNALADQMLTKVSDDIFHH